MCLLKLNHFSINVVKLILIHSLNIAQHLIALTYPPFHISLIPVLSHSDSTHNRLGTHADHGMHKVYIYSMCLGQMQTSPEKRTLFHCGSLQSWCAMDHCNLTALYAGVRACFCNWSMNHNSLFTHPLLKLTSDGWAIRHLFNDSLLNNEGIVLKLVLSECKEFLCFDLLLDYTMLFCWHLLNQWIVWQ